MNSGTLCHIVGAGDFFGLRGWSQGDIIIAADGGFEHLKAAGIKPDKVIGDLDSLTSAPEGVEFIRLKKEKDDTDMYAAVRRCFDAGDRYFHLYGGTGGRSDHTIANLQLLAWLSENGAHGVLFGEREAFTAVTNSSLEFAAKSGGFVSVFSHSDSSRGVNLSGLKYELKDYVLDNRFPLGVSNEFCGLPSTVSVKEGTLLVVFPVDAKPIF